MNQSTAIELKGLEVEARRGVEPLMEVLQTSKSPLRTSTESTARHQNTASGPATGQQSKNATAVYSYATKAWQCVLGCREGLSCGPRCWAKRTVNRLAHSPNEAVRQAHAGLVEYTSDCDECPRGPDCSDECLSASGCPDGRGDRLRWTGTVRLNEAHLLDPLKWRTSQIVATGYHGDWGLLSDSDRDRMLAAMALCPQHTFLTLTKRPERLVEYLTSTSGNTRVFGAALDASGLPIAPGKYRVLKDGYGLELVDVDVYYAGVKGLACFAPEIGSDGTGVDDPTDHHVSVQNTGLAFIGATGPWPLPNVYLGTSVSNQPEADERLPYLMKLAAAGWKTWLSIEPMVGAVDLGRFLVVRPTECTYGLSWVVIGGESGPNARDVSDDAIRSVVKECQEAQVPVYVKQLTRGGKRVPFSEWPEDLKVQQTPWEAR